MHVLVLQGCQHQTSPAQDTGHLAQGWTVQSVPVGLGPQTTYPVTLDKGCLSPSLPLCLAGEGR